MNVSHIARWRSVDNIAAGGALEKSNSATSEFPRLDTDLSMETSDKVEKDTDGAAALESGPHGIQNALATTIVWSRNSLLGVYALIFIIFFINSLQQQTSSNLSLYATSQFSQVYLLPVVNMVSNLISGIIKLPVAKFIDIWGRPQGYIAMLFCAVIGLILMASCTNFETYAAAQVFNWVGFNGISYILDVFIADSSSLQWRALLFAFTTSPYIATTFAGPAAAKGFVNGAGWRWGYGVYAIVVPLLSAPFLFIFWYNQRQAKAQGVVTRSCQASGQTWVQSAAHYFVEFDVIGILLVCAGFTLFLLPFNLAKSSAEGWQSAHIIVMLILGICMLAAFVVWEYVFATRQFLPFHYLRDSSVIGACLLPMTTWISFYCWDSYFLPYLRVVHDLDTASAGYVFNVYNLGSCFWALVVGLLVRYTGRFKWLALAAIPVQVLGTGLMIRLREPGMSIGYVVMTQILIAFSGGTLVICQEMAIMAAVGPENIAVALALQGLFTSVGGAIGSSIAGAIWTNTFHRYLLKNLPVAELTKSAVIYGDVETQVAYPIGSETRTVIINGYYLGQRYMCIAATAALCVSIPCVLMWKDFRVKDFKSPAGAKVI